MRKLLSFLDNYALSILAGFLLVFIPLYPKLPLVDILPGYIVRVRLEDIIVSFCIFLWVIYLVRGKISLFANPLYKPIAMYLAVGLLSMVSAVSITQTVPLESIHVLKMILHYARRIEYFALFFIFYSSVRSLRMIKIYVFLLVITILAVSFYGFGQKYLYWPAFSTMNREFAKGWMLYLTRHARVISTFGGHYDLAAFIMMALIILWSLFFAIKNFVVRLLLFGVIAAAFWTMILTASRTSFLAYLSGVSILFVFWAYKKGIFWSLSRWFAVVILSVVVMLSFGDLSERFTKLLKIDDRVAGIKSLLLSPIGAPPKDKALYLENNPEMALSRITSRSDQPPTTERPSDVFQDIPLMIPDAQTGSASAVARTYSRNAFLYDLSTAIRFDALWPMAIAGFKRNPILGSGYSTLNKTQITQFTDAESTDNDYLRSLGETGLLGFVTFYLTLGIIIYTVWRNLNILNEPFFFSIAVGLVALLSGLLVNAVYIDVFESSKVAFSFWAITGFTLAGVNIFRQKHRGIIASPKIADLEVMKNRFSHFIKRLIRGDFLYLFLILMLAFYLRLYKIDTPLADWHSWRQADTSAVTRNYVRHGINILYPTFDDLSNVASGKDNPKGLRFVEFPIYNVASVIVDKIIVGYNVETSGRLTSILASLSSIILLFLIVRKNSGRLTAFLSILYFAIIPYNIFYGRVVLPEPFMVFATLGMIYFFDRTCDLVKMQKRQNNTVKYYLNAVCFLILALIFTSFSILIKPFAAFLFIPLIYIYLKNFGIKFKSIFILSVFLLVSVLPFFWWRWWMSHFPEGIPANMWLLNGDGIRFKGAFFYWIFADRLARLIMGYWGVSLLILGLVHRLKKEGWLYNWWGLAILLYLVTFATGNVRHDYYQIITVPIIVIFLAKGTVLLFKVARENIGKIAALLLILSIVIFTEMFGWYHIRDFYNINHPEIVEAGQAVERMTPDKALVIAPYNGDTAFLYQTRRAGWPIMQKPLEEMIQLGASYYVSVEMDELTKKLLSFALDVDPEKRLYKLIKFTDKYTIIQLVPDKLLP